MTTREKTIAKYKKQLEKMFQYQGKAQAKNQIRMNNIKEKLQALGA